MGREYVYLSFFKTNKIDYKYHSRLKIIEFACIGCEGKAIISSVTSEWQCSNCSQSGNLVTLINFAKNNKFGRIYVPKKEQQSILKTLDRLANKYPVEEQRISLLIKKIKELVKYYENEKTPLDH